MNHEQRFILTPRARARVFGAAVTLFFLGLMCFPFVLLIFNDAPSWEETPPAYFLVAFFALWIVIPLVISMILWRFFVTSTVLSSETRGQIKCSGQFLLIPWFRVYRDTDRAWIVKRRIYHRTGVSICDAFVVRSSGRKAVLMEGVSLSTDDILGVRAWLEEVAGVPVKDLRPRAIG